MWQKNLLNRYKRVIMSFKSKLFNFSKTQLNQSFEYAKINNQKLKDKIDLKVQEKALLNLKSELIMRHKSFDDYTDEEIEIMLSNEKQKIVDDLKSKTLIGVLALFGLDVIV